MSSKSQDEVNIPNFEDVPRNAPVSMDVIYSGMPMVPMAKGVADSLQILIKKISLKYTSRVDKVDQMYDTYVTVEVDESQQVIEQATGNQIQT